MDLIEGLAKQASQITMYDVKSYYNQAKNMVLNLSEMEAKVREATNDDPWGASSTLMQQIADGTHNFAQFNEIMPTIYSRFMEKEAREWRQIYKALTLLEFLVKNGSERVVDDARAHISTIKMLRSFHYIDEKGKDQGINVRNRASEIALMLGDVEKIRVERRRAKANKSKYQGQGNDGGMSFVTTGGSRYGGFGSETLGGGGAGGGGGGGSSGYGGADYDAGDNYRPERGSSFNDRNDAQPEYDEYEGADDFDSQPPRRTTSAAGSGHGVSRSTSRSTKPQPPPKAAPKETKPAPKHKEVNLFDFDDDDTPAMPAAAPAPVAVASADDDFDDFQEAPSIQATPAAASKPPAANNNLFDLLNSSAPASASPRSTGLPTFNSQPASGGAQLPPAYQSSGMMSPSAQPSMTSRPSYTSTTSQKPAAPAAPAGGSSTFDDLWTTSLGSLGSKPTNTATTGGKTIADLEKEKAMNKLWGPTPAQNQSYGASTQVPKQSGGAFDDLLM